MTDVKLRELQLTELEILKAFRDVCEKHNLTYFLSAGTLLGAVRHKGFIPWDDDIDVTMPYTDYVRFLEIGQAELSDAYFLQSTDTERYYHFPFAKIRKNNTTMLDSYQTKWRIHHGIWIDIFPLIEVDQKSYFRTKRLIAISKALQMDNFVKIHTEEFSHLLGKKLYLLFILFKLPFRLRHYLKRKIDEFVCSAEGKDEYAELAASITYCFPKELFIGKTDLVFENEHFTVPIGYEEYLKIHFGDYMSLPPESERHGHVNIVDTKQNYTVYIEQS